MVAAGFVVVVSFDALWKFFIVFYINSLDGRLVQVLLRTEREYNSMEYVKFSGCQLLFIGLHMQGRTGPQSFVHGRFNWV